ncbi:MAG: ATP-grasp fold amidoligase family protein [Paludibacter sp.]|nr:ATP-grasp fold amidoligase family protein [Paludibacter sp.]MDD4428910.1 ATP-grasp fold amidoligase family protein [Paludibacter sp.]
MTLEDIFWGIPEVRKIYWSVQPAKWIYKLSPELGCKLIYRACCGKKLDLNDPQTYNEKIQWLKLYDSSPLKTTLADKYLVKEWVAERIGDEYIIPTLGVWDSFDDIDFGELPNQFVLKATHGSGMNIIVRDKTTFDISDARKKYDLWMKRNLGYHTLELHYIDIQPRIIAEPYIENSGGNLYDYKIHCFNGEPKYIHYIGERAQNTTKEVFLDVDWNTMPFITGTYPRFIIDIPKPSYLSELLHISEALAKDFAYVRVDFYVLNDGSFLFGEMTFAPGSGFYHWDPPEYDKIIGDEIKLPNRRTAMYNNARLSDI